MSDARERLKKRLEGRGSPELKAIAEKSHLDLSHLVHTVDCMICQKEIQNYDPKMCCSGHDCGCMGRPTEPPICSGECWDKLMARNSGESNEQG